MVKSLSVRRWSALLVPLLGFGLSFTFAMVAEAQDYILGAEDKLKIRVFEWRPVTGSTFEWVPLNGEFVVSAGGSVSLPIIGSLPAAGLTINQFADSIGQQLQEQVGMQKRPVASVEIAEYRPFFITGLVAKPGRFSFSPGLTVVQALSMAGGTSIAVDASVVGLTREILANQGDLRTLQIERLGLLARQARLDAIIDSKPSITFPDELKKLGGLPVVARMMREEQDLFETRHRSVMAQIDALNQAKVLATNQIDALKTKASSLAKQIDLANKDMANVNKLLSAGLTVSSRSLGASQNLSDLESRNLDVSLASLKASQDVAKSDQDIADASNRYRVDTLTEAAEVRDRLAANTEKAETTRAMLSVIMEHAPINIGATLSDQEPGFDVKINRLVEGKVTTMTVGDNDLIVPGDVLRVVKRPPSTESGDSLTEGN